MADFETVTGKVKEQNILYQEARKLSKNGEDMKMTQKPARMGAVPLVRLGTIWATTIKKKQQ